MPVNKDISRRSFLKNSAGVTAATIIPGIFPFSFNPEPENPSASAEEQKFMLSGFAETDISPEIGMEQVSNYRKQFHRFFHDSCKVRVLFLMTQTGQLSSALILL